MSLSSLPFEWSVFGLTANFGFAALLGFLLRAGCVDRIAVAEIGESQCARRLILGFLSYALVLTGIQTFFVLPANMPRINPAALVTGFFIGFLLRVGCR